MTKTKSKSKIKEQERRTRAKSKSRSEENKRACVTSPSPGNQVDGLPGGVIREQIKLVDNGGAERQSIQM